MAVPAVGDEVLYHAPGPDGGEPRWYPAEVMSFQLSGQLTLLYAEGTATAVHGAHIHGWLTYDEMVKYAREHASA